MTNNERERMAIRGVFGAIFRAGIEINSFEAMELATRMLSYVTGKPKMTVDELKPKMLAVMLEDLAGADTVH
jgi:hypothetical protein